MSQRDGVGVVGITDVRQGVGGMDNELGNLEDKKAYEAPKVTTISLRPEEAVVGHFKSPSAGGGVGGTCFFVGGCPSQGS